MLPSVTAWRDLGPRAFRLAVGAVTVAELAALLAILTRYPPHEDEALALFVGRHSLGETLDIVLLQRGGAPVHFVLAWVVVHLGGGLVALRLLSVLFAVASVPVLALLCARLAGRTAGLIATLLASASWMMLFYGVYGRMYSLFLLASALSSLALLAAVDGGGRRRWALWAAAALLTAAAHPYGALVLASQAVFVVLLRKRLREAVVAFTAVAVAGVPFWLADAVLAGRLDVDLGGDGDTLRGPAAVLSYLRDVAADFSSGYAVALAAVLALAGLGFIGLVRRRTPAGLLTAAVLGTPAVVLFAATAGDSASPETRHFTFALPFFATSVAVGILEVARRFRGATTFALAGVTAVLALEVAWAADRTPLLFSGEPADVEAARGEAAEWLARTSRPDDALFGYEPVYLVAWERSRGLSRTVVPRADAELALDTLLARPGRIGRGVWILDGSDSGRRRVARRSPGARFDVRAFGPYLVVRTRVPERNAARFLADTALVQRLGLTLGLKDASVNYGTARRALAALAHR